MEKQKSTAEILGIEETWADKLLSPFVWVWAGLRNGCYDLRCRCQRFRRGYSNRDVVEMADWFVCNARPMLQRLSESTYHYPPELTEEQWRQILAEMAQLLDIMDLQDDTAARKAASIPEDARGSDVISQISEEQLKAKERFFFLFNKWFYDL